MRALIPPSFLTLLVLIAGCGQNQAAQVPTTASNAQKSINLMALQAAVDLGVVVQGEDTTFHQWIKNRSDHEIGVEKITVSCDCLSVHLSQKHIEPKGRILASFHYDSSHEPDFTGGLEIIVEFFDPDKKQVGELTASIDVVRRPKED